MSETSIASQLRVSSELVSFCLSSFCDGLMKVL